VSIDDPGLTTSCW